MENSRNKQNHRTKTNKPKIHTQITKKLNKTRKDIMKSVDETTCSRWIRNPPFYSVKFDDFNLGTK